MKIVNFEDEQSLQTASKSLLAGETIFYPTDTIYGLGCLADDVRAVEELYKIKHRPGHQPSLILINSWVMLEKYCQVRQEQLDYLKNIWPGRVTVILQGQGNLSAVSGDGDSIAVRWPDHPWLDALLEVTKRPVVSTSANLSGAEPVKSVAELESNFAGNLPDLAIDAGELNSQASKLIDLRNFPDIKIIRN